MDIEFIRHIGKLNTINPPKKPIVSVVIPTYNRSFCIAQTLDSVFKQTYSDYEVIVVDDGSTDNTAEIIKGYGELVRYVYQQNSGASAARNTGVHIAHGDWIAFLDSDDEWFPDKLKIQMDDVSANPNAVAHMVDAIIGDQQHFPGTLFSLRGTRTKYEHEPVRQRPLIDVLETQFFTPCWLLNRKAIQSAGSFNTSKRIFEDIDLLTRVALQGPFLVNCYVGTHVHRKPGDSGALSHLYQTSRQESLKNIITMYENLNLSKKLTKKEVRYVKKELAAYYLELAITQGKYKKTTNYYNAIISSLKYNHSLFGLAKVLALLMIGVGGFEALRRIKNIDKKDIRH
jgi:glycosyltransferase involved in cell wall biosynthesis